MVAPGRPSYDGPMAPDGGQLEGKVVLVSGGASDIGRATALRLAGAGAAVVMIGSCKTVPTKFSLGALRVGREPARWISMEFLPDCGRCVRDYFFVAA